jgi:hypothetical protein
MPLAVAALLLVACAPAALAPEVDAATTDLDLLLERLEDTHPEPFHGVDREEWVADLREVEQQLPTLTDAESVVAVMRLVARLSAEGRDGHQFALPQSGHEGTVLPLRVYELDGGLVVTAAMDPYAALVGGRIEAVDGTPVAEVLDLVEPLVPRDGPATVPTFRPIFTVRSQVLQGLGITADDTVTLTVDGEDAAVEAVPFAEHAAWAGRFGEFRLPELPGAGYRSRYEDVQRSRWLGDALHVRLTEIQETPSARTLRRLEDPRLRRVVLDLRQNPGGDNTHNLPWVTALDEAPLVVLTDRATFSAAANLVTDLEQTLDPVFVGEAMGGGLNFWDDVAQVRLDDLPVPMQVGVSTRYWQRAAADDPRLTIEPDVPVEVTAADVLAGRDPALRAALEVPLG